MAKDPNKISVFRWQGILAEGGRTLRSAAGLILGIACAVFAFTQLGFSGIGFNGNYSAYAVVLLQPIALAALLLGTRVSTVMGLWAGLMAYAHALYMPMDYYEFAFITPFSSIVMLTIVGFLLGILFARALRNNPGQPRRFIHIVIICVVISWFYSLGFLANVFAQLFNYVATSGAFEVDGTVLTETLRTEVTTAALQLGNIGVQAWFDAVLMTILCFLADIAVKSQLRTQGNISMRALFTAWLSAVFLGVFMITAALSFVVISMDLRDVFLETMRSDMEYVVDQLEAADNRSVMLDELLSTNASMVQNDSALTQNLAESISISHILDGYVAEEDGIIVVIDANNIVVLSDDTRFPIGENMSNLVDNRVIEAVQKSAANDSIVRIVFTERRTNTEDQTIASHLSYLLARQNGGRTVIVAAPAERMFEGRSTIMLFTTLSSFILLLAVFALTSYLLKRIIGQRIDETNTVLKQITEGNLNAHVDVHDTTEFASLSEGINNTVDTLKEWINEAETRMDEELATAKAIQESALPRVFPPYPDILRFDVYASMNAAREVGGDFYDFFLIGDACTPDAGKLGFVIADVSGKGVPAALFMMQAKTQLRDYVASGMELGEAVENTNRQLCEGNDAGMFVTMFVGVLDYATNHVDYVNAGHNPPLLWMNKRTAESAGEGEAAPAVGWHWLKNKSGMPLGLFDNLSYEAFGIDCEIGDQFLLYTDGVTEAMSTEGALYGEERLEAVLSEHYPLHPRALTEVVRHSVAEHAAGAEQSDDITLLALEVGTPPEITATLTVAADVDELPRVNEFIHTELDRRLCPLRAQKQLDIAVEELFVNVAHYAYPQATPENPGTARISYTYSAEPPSITVDIADDGIPYNPLEKPDAVTPDAIEDVPVGGLGILMAKKSVDEMHYEHADGSNIVTIVKKW